MPDLPPQPWPANARPSPEQFHAWLADHRDDPAVTAVVANLLADCDRAHTCVVENHRGRLARYEARPTTRPAPGSPDDAARRGITVNDARRDAGLPALHDNRALVLHRDGSGHWPAPTTRRGGIRYGEGNDQ